MIKNIYLIRHGESQRQAQESEDRVNSPLSALGRRQAERLRKRFAGVALDVLYVSPLTRAVQTVDGGRLAAKRVMMDSRVIELGQGPAFYQDVALTDPPDGAEPDRHGANG